MSKIALITDLHFGVKNNSVIMLEHFRRFYQDIFFPVLQSNQIDTVVILGDVYDRRPHTSHAMIKASKDILFNELNALYTTYVIVGNHDCPYKESLEANSPSLLLKEFSHIHIIDRPMTVLIHGTPMTMIPWIVSDNEKDCMEMIHSSHTRIAMGHFELDGFEMYRGQAMIGGQKASLFGHFEKVLSGHFHHRSTKRNITYLGTPYDLCWNDWNDARGMHILDTETLDLEFIENPNRLFVRLEYNDGWVQPLDHTMIENSFVKVNVVSKSDYYAYDVAMKNLSTIGIHDVKINEHTTDVFESMNTTIDETIHLEETLSILSNFIDGMDLDSIKDDVKMFIHGLYAQAQELESV